MAGGPSVRHLKKIPDVAVQFRHEESGMFHGIATVRQKIHTGGPNRRPGAVRRAGGRRGSRVRPRSARLTCHPVWCSTWKAGAGSGRWTHFGRLKPVENMGSVAVRGIPLAKAAPLSRPVGVREEARLPGLHCLPLAVPLMGWERISVFAKTKIHGTDGRAEPKQGERFGESRVSCDEMAERLTNG
jgi:hypothetical protein